jgi:hypothetical protein
MSSAPGGEKYRVQDEKGLLQRNRSKKDPGQEYILECQLLAWSIVGNLFL